MKVVFFGMNSLFSVMHFLALREQHDVAAVFITRSRQSAGNTLKKIVSTVTGRESSGAYSLEKSCNVYGVACHVVDSVNDAACISMIRNMNAGLICVAGFSEKLSAELLDIPAKGVLNSHPSLLPDYKGAHPFFRMIRMNNVSGGCTVHFMDNGFDTGNIIMQKPIQVIKGINLNIYNVLAAQEGALMMQECVSRIANGTIDSLPQQHGNNINSRNPTSADLLIDASFHVEQVLWMYNAFSDSMQFKIRDQSGEKQVVRISKSPFEGSSEFVVTDGKVYYKSS